MLPPRPLSNMQRLFVQEYLVDLNATQAALRAGYSKKTASRQGPQMLKLPAVAAAIAEAMDKRAAEVEYTALAVLQRHADIDRMDIADILDDAGDLLPIKQWPAVWRKTINGVEISVAGGTATLKKVKWPDKLRNLEMLGRHVNVKAYVESASTTAEADVASALHQLLAAMPD